MICRQADSLEKLTTGRIAHAPGRSRIAIDLHFVEFLRLLLPMPCDERHRRPFFQQDRRRRPWRSRSVSSETSFGRCFCLWETEGRQGATNWQPPHESPTRLPQNVVVLARPNNSRLRNRRKAVHLSRDSHANRTPPIFHAGSRLENAAKQLFFAASQTGIGKKQSIAPASRAKPAKKCPFAPLCGGAQGESASG